MPLLSRGHISGWLAGEITKLSRDMEDLKEVEWTIPIMQEYILQVEDLGDAVKGILNMELDVAVPQMVALPSKLAQVLRFTWYMIPEGWLRMAKKALLKLIDLKKAEERREAWEDKLYLQHLRNLSNPLEILPLAPKLPVSQEGPSGNSHTRLEGYPP